MADEILPPDRIRRDERLVAAVARVTDAGLWFVDVESANLHSLHRVKEVLDQKQSKYQLIQLVELEEVGKTLVLDGRIQLTEADEHIYHEMLVHPAMAWEEYKSVLVLGGGDGCILREVLKWKSVERIVQVELDEAVTEICRRHCPEWNAGAFDDPRVEVRFEDAMNVLAEREKFGLVIADLTEPYDDSGVAGDLSSGLFCAEFYGAIKKKLTRRGMFVAQTGGLRLGRSSMDPHHVEFVNGIKQAFRDVRVAYEFIPSFQAFWTATFASMSGFHGSPRFEEMWRTFDEQVWDDINDRLERHGVQTAYYDGLTHMRLFTPPVDPVVVYGWPEDTTRRGCCW